MIKDGQSRYFPMNFDLSPEERTFQSQVRVYLQGVTDGWDIPVDDEEYQACARVVREGLGGRGWLTLGWGKGMDSRLGALAAGLRRNDGEADSPVKAAILQEELAYYLVPRANDHGTNLTGPLLLRHGTPEQRERHLGLLAEGREWWCVGFTEPLAGSDLANIKTRAVAQGGDFVLTGQKDYGEWAQLSGWCHLLARTERGSTGRDGLTWFLLDMSTPGLFLNPVEYTTGRVFAEIFLDDVVVPESAILGERGRGWDIVDEFLTEARSGFEHIGWARRMLDLALESGGGGAGLRARLAEASVDIEVARLLSYRSIWPGREGAQIRRQTSIAKLFSSEVFQRVAETAMNTIGLQGQGAGRLAQSLYLEAAAASIYLGTSEVHRTIISALDTGPRAHRT